MAKLSALALCWRVERSDGAGVAVTTHDAPIKSDGDHYVPEPAIVPAAVTRALGLEPHSSEVTGALSARAITEHDLGLGLWDGARVTLVAVDWLNPESQTTTLLAGELGEVSSEQTRFTAELHGASAKLRKAVCPSTSAECRAELGDKECRANLAGQTIRARVQSSNGTHMELDAAIDGSFAFGRIRFLSGPNCGAPNLMLEVDGSAVKLRDLPRAPVAAGTVVELRVGCDKRIETCSTRFQNAVNFRGEPHLPGNDLLTRYPGA